MATVIEKVEVTQTISVEVDKSKFTQEFIDEFREHFYDFGTLEDHLRHLAQMYARGLVTDYSQFIEGYGDVKEFGISFIVEDQTEEILSA